MDKRLSDVLFGTPDNYLLPFYWQHGDHTELIPEQIDRIYRSGCRALCVESRPHPDFVGEGWWRDMDIILEEAKKRGMKVWILDDDKFPTGHAAGMIEKKYPEKRQWNLIERHIDVVGPAKDISVLYDGEDEENILVGIYAYPRNADNLETCKNQPIDLTDKVKGNFLYWDILEGVYRIFFYYKSRKGGFRNYIDMIDKDSVRVLIDAVYESHYEHYSEYFGNTLVGFFSDEPAFENQVFGKERFDFGFYEAKIGKHSLALPWNERVLIGMRERLGYDPIPHLNLLWYEDDVGGADQGELRHAYMDMITKLYAECFTKQIGDWCRAHNVMYIGHIIEDMNCHMRGGVGHYFRALRDQDMSGIDIVLHQVMPGMADYIHTVTCATGAGAGSFYEYILAKLGASLAHLDPSMKGRAMCEVFGAYGYGEDSVLMKFLMDHLLVRGINHFVPHAFSSKFPDADCPPHFGAEGKDPSFEAFTALMNYTNKAAHILFGATHKANAAILYHVDGEWASRFDEAENMEGAATRLYDAHIDYDIVPLDMLRESARVEDGKLLIAGERFDCLIVPYATRMPLCEVEALKRLRDAGLPVWFMRGLPENLTFVGEVVEYDELIAKMRAAGFTDVFVEGEYPKLRIYHCARDGKDIYMLANEHFAKHVDTTVTLPSVGEYAKIDLISDLAFCGVTDDGRVRIRLAPGQSWIIVFGDGAGLPKEGEITLERDISPVYSLELARFDALDKFESAGSFDHFFNVAKADFRPGFSGKMRYSFDITVEDAGDRVYLDLGRVGQNAELYVGGEYAGIRISAPYLFDITDKVVPGENRITVTVSNTLGGEVRDHFTKFLQLNPSGLLGEMKLIYTK